MIHLFSFVIKYLHSDNKNKYISLEIKNNNYTILIGIYDLPDTYITFFILL